MLNEPPDNTSAAPHTAYAGFWARVAARLCDLLLLITVAYLFHFVIVGSGLSLFNTILANGYFVFFGTTFGATPGNMLFHQRIIMSGQATDISVKTAFKRLLVEGLTLGIAYFFIPFDREKRGLHDRVAHTVVVAQ